MGILLNFSSAEVLLAIVALTLFYAAANSSEYCLPNFDVLFNEPSALRFNLVAGSAKSRSIFSLISCNLA
ncbi:MAG: hypothetical protein MSA56_00095 [Clostridium sp.]|uniref:Uncharacterized protein n=1 Tax=Siphoviridae sp. ct2vX3 TaxID=2825318 RepID=A0A8S5PXC4_9CAUD|nr:hypothetical protein [Clostridium sp.]DAE11694.1 MAG TPA: hypothetical protein [Siphoviridae sp. ct2vX3]